MSSLNKVLVLVLGWALYSSYGGESLTPQPYGNREKADPLNQPNPILPYSELYKVPENAKA